jgi:hypothetical protein
MSEDNLQSVEISSDGKPQKITFTNVRIPTISEMEKSADISRIKQKEAIEAALKNFCKKKP